MMFTLSSAPQARAAIDEARAAVGRNWGWILTFGLLLVALGIFAASHAIAATVASVYVLGWLMVIAGVVHVASSFAARAWNVGLSELLIGALYLIGGVLMLRSPMLGSASITLMMSLFFLIGGASRILSAMILRLPSWGWAVVHGIITVALGAMLLSEWPGTAAWAIGLFVGLDMFFAGCSACLLAFEARHWREETTPPATFGRGAPAGV